MTIITAGCFDVIHIGHINLLLFCRQLAGPNGQVIVYLDSDEKMKEDKRAPIFTYEERRAAVFALTLYGNPVVSVVYSHMNNYHLNSVVEQIKPDYIVVGSDYKDKDVVGSDHAKVIFFERDQRFSSTKIIGACISKNC